MLEGTPLSSHRTWLQKNKVTQFRSQLLLPAFITWESTRHSASVSSDDRLQITVNCSMLPWRLASRGFGAAGKLQRNALLNPVFKPRRTAYTNPAWNPYPPRAPGVVPKLLYRADGKPRAKWKGAALGGFLLFLNL